MLVYRLYLATIAIVLMAITAVAAHPLVSPSVSVTAAISDATSADQWLQQGNTQYQAGHIEAAIQLWHQARTAYQRRQNDAGEGAALANLGAAYVKLEHYRDAIGVLESLRSLAPALNDRHTEAQAFGNLGIAYQALGNYVKAIEAHKQAIKMMLLLDDRQSQGQSLGNLGSALAAVGDYKNAKSAYQESLKLAQQTGDRVGVSIALSNLGAIDAEQDKSEAALSNFQQSLKVSQDLGDRAAQASTLVNLGSVYQSLSKKTEAIHYYQESLKLARAANVQRPELEALSNLGLAYEDLHDYQRAMQCQEQSLTLARAIGDPRAEAITLNNLGHILFSTGHLAAAEAKLRMAMTLRESLRSDLDDIYKISIIDTQLYTYTLLQKVLVAANKPEAALEVAEQGRARAFVALLARRLTQRGNSQVDTPETLELPPTIQQIRQIAQRRKATIVEYTILTDNNFKFRGKLRGPEAELLIWVIQPEGKVTLRRVSLKALRQQKTTLTGLISATIGCLAPGSDCQSFQGLVVQNSPDPKSTQAPSALNYLKGKQSLPSTANQPQAQTSFDNPGLQKLHQILIQPIADLLPNNPATPVIFIPQEALFSVPFPALQDSTGKYLIEKHTVLTAPAIQVLDLTYKQRQKQIASVPKSKLEDSTVSTHLLTGAALVVGNPTMPKVVFNPGKPPEQLLSLPGAEEEAKEVAELLHTGAIIGPDATKANVVQQLPGARIIHLATHGLLEYGQHNGFFLRGLEVPGAIALAPFEKDDGLLTATEIMQFKLTAELVVLSACNTGQGHITGDGVVGLSRAWIAAGVPSVIVSLWTVPDDATAILMTEFYINLQENPDKAQALRQAMLSTMKEHPRPIDWAAFTLIGEAE